MRLCTKGGFNLFSLLRRNDGKISLVGDMLCCILVFPFSFTLLENFAETLQKPGSADLTPWVCILFATLALSRLFRAFRLREQSKSAFVAHLVYGFAFGAGAVFTGIVGYSDQVGVALSLLFWATLISDRVLAILRRHNLWSIVLNGIAILLFLAIAFVASQLYPMVITGTGILASTFVSIMVVTFSRVKLDVLKEIVRKTYAGEIIFGLLLLMISFSYVLKFADPAFESFWDGLWYCFAVVTTIGFGDFTPTTTVGRVLSVVLGIYGIVVVALITSIIVNFYGEMKKADAADNRSDTDP